MQREKEGELLLTVLLAVFRWETGAVMDGHDAKIHSDQCSGSTGRLSRTVPDCSEGDSTKSLWLDANLFLFPTNNIGAELTTVLANMLAGAAFSLWPGSVCWALGFTGRGELFVPDKPRCPSNLGRAEWSRSWVSCPWSCTQSPHWGATGQAGWMAPLSHCRQTQFLNSVLFYGGLFPNFTFLLAAKEDWYSSAQAPLASV